MSSGSVPGPPLARKTAAAKGGACRHRDLIVRGAFDAYHAQGRDTAEQLLAEDLTFTSAQDDHSDKAAYLARFPTADRLVSQEVLELVEAGDEGVFTLDDYELKAGERHRNTEPVTVPDGRVVQIRAFVGGRVRPSVRRPAH